jgi:DNA-binding protein H-NS
MLMETPMSETYAQIRKQIDELQRRAEKVRQQEIQGVVSRIKVAIEHYGLTAAQLGFGFGTGKSRNEKRKSATTAGAKYSDGMGHSWSGRGPRPKWLREALEAGKPLQDFTAQESPRNRKAAAAPAPVRRKSTRLYRDGNGNSWTGMGPRPRWLREALESGRRLEDFAVASAG